MSDEKDIRIAAILKQGAPPPRDPLFRLQVLERREQRRFQQRLFTMLAGMLVIALASAIAIRLGAGAAGTAGALVAVASLASACLAFRRSLPGILRRLTL